MAGLDHRVQRLQCPRCLLWKSQMDPRVITVRIQEVQCLVICACAVIGRDYPKDGAALLVGEFLLASIDKLGI
jgi:hypothetical protein